MRSNASTSSLPRTRTSARGGSVAAVAGVASGGRHAVAIATPTAAWRQWIRDIATSYAAGVKFSLSAAGRVGPANEPSHQLPRRAEIEVKIFRREAELLADVADRLLEPHQRDAHRFDFFRRERLLFHAANGLAFHQPPQELDDRQYELRDRFLHVLGLGIPSHRRGAAPRTVALGRRCLDRSHSPFELAPQRAQVGGGDRRGIAGAASRAPILAGRLRAVTARAGQ